MFTADKIAIQSIENPSILISEEESKRITSLRFLLIIFVVFIHSNLTVNDAINYYHYDFVQPKWIEVFKEFVCVTLGGELFLCFFYLHHIYNFQSLIHTKIF